MEKSTLGFHNTIPAKYINMTNFEAFPWNIVSSTNLKIG